MLSIAAVVAGGFDRRPTGAKLCVLLAKLGGAASQPRPEWASCPSEVGVGPVPRRGISGRVAWGKCE